MTIRSDLNDIVKDFGGITRKVQKIVKSMENYHQTITENRGLEDELNLTETVLAVFQSNKKKKLRFQEVQDQTGLETKQVRNIIFRQRQLGTLVSIDRGCYKLA